VKLPFVPLKCAQLGLIVYAAVHTEAALSFISCVKLRTSGDMLGSDKYITAPHGYVKRCPADSC
jgi:hypothetical protein